MCPLSTYLAYEFVSSIKCYVWRFVAVDYFGLCTSTIHFGNTLNINFIQIPSIDTVGERQIFFSIYRQGRKYETFESCHAQTYCSFNNFLTNTLRAGHFFNVCISSMRRSIGAPGYAALPTSLSKNANCSASFDCCCNIIKYN